MDVSKVTYKEIKDKGIVIAQIDNIEFDALDKINGFISCATSKVNLHSAKFHWEKDSDLKERKYFMPTSMKSIARCHPNDTYSYEKGKSIALKKLSEKYNRSLDRRVARFTRDMSKAVKCAEKYLENKTL